MLPSIAVMKEMSTRESKHLIQDLDHILTHIFQSTAHLNCKLLRGTKRIGPSKKSRVSGLDHLEATLIDSKDLGSIQRRAQTLELTTLH